MKKSTFQALYDAAEAMRKDDTEAAKRAIEEAVEGFKRFEKRVNEIIRIAEGRVKPQEESHTEGESAPGNPFSHVHTVDATFRVRSRTPEEAARKIRQRFPGSHWPGGSVEIKGIKSGWHR